MKKNKKKMEGVLIIYYYNEIPRTNNFIKKRGQLAHSFRDTEVRY